MKPCTSKICDECPYRKNSSPGFFGGNPIDIYADAILYDIRIPCHKTVNLKEARFCAGLAATRVRSFKAAREDEVIIASENVFYDMEKSDRPDNVFQWHSDFVSYHQQYDRD